MTVTNHITALVVLLMNGVLWLLLTIVLPCGVLYILYFLFSLPLRRQERARFVLDLVERELIKGQSLERAVVALAQSHDRSLGVRFYLLAAHVENGLRLSAALDKVPRLLPPPVTAMLKVGEEIGDMRKVLPACRKLLQDGRSQTWSGVNYLIFLLCAFTPACFAVLQGLNIFVMPKFFAIAADMEVSLSSSFLRLLGYSFWLSAGSVGIFFVILAGALFYVGGARFSGWLEGGLLPFTEKIFYRVPWRRKRMQRDFSAMLAILLDAEVPEDKAVRLAARCTANTVFMRRAEDVVAELRQGVKLTEALRRLDDTGEFRWRVTNAAHAHGGFFQALAGWHEALDAKAFQLEQTAAQSMTTGLVLLNGVLVGLVTVSVFHVLVAIIQAGVLW